MHKHRLFNYRSRGEAAWEREDRRCAEHTERNRAIREGIADWCAEQEENAREAELCAYTSDDYWADYWADRRYERDRYDLDADRENDSREGEEDLGSHYGDDDWSYYDPDCPPFPRNYSMSDSDMDLPAWCDDKGRFRP